MKTTQPARRFQRCYFVSILASLSGTLYAGLTDDLRRRMTQHKAGLFDGFTKKYKVNRLLYFETYGDSKIAAEREQQIKKFRREKKIALFAESNAQWKDITPEIFWAIAVPPLRQAQGRDYRKKTLEGDVA
jgi:putative endonuclease